MPGSRVDVYSGGEGKENPHSQLVISDVEVGAVGQSMNEVDKDGKTVRITKSVTLFLRPEEVEQLPAGRRNLRLALRGSGKPVAKEGQDRGNGDPSFWESVFARAKEKPAAAPASPKQRVLEVVRGKEIENLTFIETGGPGQYELVNSDAPQGKSVGKPERAKPARPPSPE